MDHTPLLSVGIAVFRSDYLEHLFQTLQNQTYENVEYIVSIDSPDDPIIQRSVKIFQSSVANVKVYNHRPALGSWENAHFVYEKAAGDYFMRLDDDDSLKQNTHLESLVNKLNEGYDYVFANVDVEDWQNGKHISTRRNTMKCYENCGSNFDFAKASLEETAMLFYAMFRMVSLNKVYHYLKNRGNTFYFGEGVFAHGVASTLNGCYIPEETFVYRMHDNNISRTVAVKNYFYDYKQYFIKSLKCFMRDTDFSFPQKLQLSVKLILKAAPILVRYYLSGMKQGFSRISFIN